MPRWIILPLAFGACAESEVSVRGTVFSGAEDAAPLAGAEIRILDGAGKLYERSKADAKGAFEVPSPPNADIVAEVRADGFEASTFPGVIGDLDVFRVPDGTLFGVPSEELEALRATFQGCPGVDGAGGVVFGEVRVRELTEPGTDIHPLVSTGAVSLKMDEGTKREACYLDDEGLSWREGAAQTGLSGRFAIFDVPPGFGTLTVAYAYTPETIVEERKVVFLPKGGVSPWFPAWVSFPF